MESVAGVISRYRVPRGQESAVSPPSAAFPILPVQEFLPFLEFDDSIDETTRMRRFADWVRSQQFGV